MNPSKEKTAEERASYKTIDRTDLSPEERADLLIFGFLSARYTPGGAEIGRATAIKILAEAIVEYESLRLTNQRLEAEVERMKIVLLPMAKGYAAEHPVGNNQQMVNEIESCLRSLESRGEQKGER